MLSRYAPLVLPDNKVRQFPQHAAEETEGCTMLTRLRPQAVYVVPLLQPRLTAALQHIQTPSAVVNA